MTNAPKSSDATSLDWLDQVEKFEVALPPVAGVDCLKDPQVVAAALTAIADKLEEK
jgi:carbon monoxide dehydrogenase subunit G